MSKRILITGGAGFIGTHLARNLVTAGHDVTLVDVLSPQIHGDTVDYVPPDGTRFIRADVRSLHGRIELLEDKDVIYHLAAETGTGQSMYRIMHYVDVNEVGTASLLEGLAKCSQRSRRIILASSRSIYGEGAYRDPDNATKILHPAPRSAEQLSKGIWDFFSEKGERLIHIPTPESLPPMPGSVYASTKMSQELLIGSAAHALGVSVIKFRLQNVYGEGQSLRNPYTGIISIFFNQARQGLPINIFEDGEESRDFVHVSDVVAAFMTAIDADIPASSTLNVGRGEPVSVLEIAQKLCREAGVKPEVFVSGDYRVGDIRHCYADISAIRAAIGFEPKIDIDCGLSRFANWARNQPVFEDKSKQAFDELRERGLTR